MTGRDRASPEGGGRGNTPPLLRVVGAISALLDWSGRIIASASLAVLFVVLLMNVILRYAFGSGLTWAYEIHYLLLPWMVGAGIVIASARHRHIAITLLPDVLGPRMRRGVLLAIEVAIVVISVSVLWSSQPILRASHFQTLSTLGITQIWGYASLVYAFAGMAVIACADIFSILGGVDVMDHDPEHASLS